MSSMIHTHPPQVVSHRFAHSDRSLPSRGGSRHGVALILVLVLVAMVSVMAWGMLASSSIRTQMNSNAAEILQAQYLAESGASLGVHYLQSPGSIQLTTNPVTGDAYWAGQASMILWSGAIAPVDVVISNPAAGKFVVTSVARLTVGSASITPGVSVQVTRMKSLDNFPLSTALLTNAQISSLLFPLMGGSTVAPDCVPNPSQIRLVQQLSLASPSGQLTRRAYNINGVSGFAQRLSSSVNAAWPVLDAAINPLNIWWTESNISIGTTSLDGGTLVVLGNRRLRIAGNPTFNAGANLPAIIATGDLDISPSIGSTGSMNANGVVYVGGQITGSSSSLATNGSIDGALIFSGEGTSTVVTSSNSFRGRISVNFNLAKSRLPSFVTMSNNMDHASSPVQVMQWDSLDE